MVAPDPAHYLRIADHAAKQADALRSVGAKFAALGDRTRALLGGTATGLDLQMIQSTQEARRLLDQAGEQYANAASQARRAAQEAQEMAEAEARQQAERRRS